ncbi:hypothetical protein VCRA2113O223_40098 [Vibrio crassostreae]|uniref:Uncharacterized protein n=1 Tax=Vibrio crassostreae TaxID=246167 RepID=A0A822MUJ1_9VIBR|nr:hypothetical protein VCRA2113O227_40098 [Vibrio crassostreae]CAK2161314.1 hypothetical protein VCRA2113O200_40098 [Vibrio crassostreae]CAK2531162.1 hypothetical protein VCRA2113O223_40098 [Vibrio crassostreae]CAK3103908.1 hypothetical protein VCRA2127O302_40098 [Vibrio crassostreae]CDT31825.1 hypothetical protein VCR5J5_240247 [Vibrio crassostreae]
MYVYVKSLNEADQAKFISLVSLAYVLTCYLICWLMSQKGASFVYSGLSIGTVSSSVSVSLCLLQ